MDFIRIYLNGSFYRVRNPNYTLIILQGCSLGSTLCMKLVSESHSWSVLINWHIHNTKWLCYAVPDKVPKLNSRNTLSQEILVSAFWIIQMSDYNHNLYMPWAFSWTFTGNSCKNLIFWIVFDPEHPHFHAKTLQNWV